MTEKVTPKTVKGWLSDGQEIAFADDRVGCFVMGTSDLAKDLHAAHTPDRIPFMTSLGLCILAARAAGIGILDGVHLDLNDDEGFRAASFMTLVLLLIGTFFYSHAESWTLLDSFYFCVMTMTTIGYGDLTPTTNFSKIFTIVYAFISIGIFVSLAAKLATALFRHSHES